MTWHLAVSAIAGYVAFACLLAFVGGFVKARRELRLGHRGLVCGVTDCGQAGERWSQRQSMVLCDDCWGFLEDRVE